MDTQDPVLDDELSFQTPSERQQYRRYRKRHLIPDSLLAKDSKSAFITEERLVQQESPDAGINQKNYPLHPSPGWSSEVDYKASLAKPGLTPSKQRFAHGTADTPPRSQSLAVKAVKEEQDEINDSAELSFERFGLTWDSAVHGFVSPSELIQQFESTCRDLAEMVRDEATDCHRITEDRIMRQKSQILYSEAASWCLLWHLYGKGGEEMDSEDAFMSPATSFQQAYKFINADQNAQLCLRIVHWLEELSSKELELEKKRKGWYAGSYIHGQGVWHQTQHAIRKKVGQATLVHHLDPDAPTRENARIHPEDQKLEENLLEDVWKLIRAGRVREAQELCRVAGQAWRAASLGGCAVMGCAPSVEMWRSHAMDRALQAVELESGFAHQRRLWKWACFCASEKLAESGGGRYETAIFAAQAANLKCILPVCNDWESACWAIVRSWLDVQVEMELGHIQANQNESAVDMSIEANLGPEGWPQPVVDQQPRDLLGVFQKLSSSDLVHDNVRRSCKEQHRLVQMDLALGNIPHLLDLLKSWVLPSQDGGNVGRPGGHPQMIRFSAHLVLLLRSILPEDMKQQFKEKLFLIGDLILNTYAIYLFTWGKEELVGAYASQLAPHLCVELFVHMMDLRQNDSDLVKRKVFYAAMEYLPYVSEDSSVGCVSKIFNRFLDQSREVKRAIKTVKDEEPADYQQLALQKAKGVQWLCFTPPASIPNADRLKAELLARALKHSNILFREFCLASLWRSTTVPVGAHVLLGHLAEPLKQESEAVFALDQEGLQGNFQEFEDWREFFACDALYRNWLKSEEISSVEEGVKALSAAQQALDATLMLLNRNKGMWLALDASSDHQDDSVEWLEMKVTAVVLSADACFLPPDATICTALTGAFYTCVEEIVTNQRQLSVNVVINTYNPSFVDIVVRCLAIEGDGFGYTAHDGGLLSTVVVAGIKGELQHFQVGVMLEVLRLDAWTINRDGAREPADYIVRGLCRRCCLPELVLRCLQIKASLANALIEEDGDYDVLELVASSSIGLHYLFSQRQLQELLLLEREQTICSMEARENDLQMMM